MLMLLIMEDSNSRSEMDQNSDSRAVARAKEAPRVINKEKVVSNHVVTLEPTTHLVSVQHMEKRKVHFRAYCQSSRNNQQHGCTPSRGPRHHHEVEQDDNGDDWTFSLNHNEVVIKFADSVTKVKGSKNVMFDEIELSRVLVDLKVQAALNPNENCAPVPNNGCPLHKLQFKLDSGAHGNLMPISMYKSLFPGLPHDVLRKSIDKRVTLVAYNKQEIKQLGRCCINVSNPSTSKSKTSKFFVVGDSCNPITRLHDSIALNLFSVNVPFTDRWTDKSCPIRTDNIDVKEIGEEKFTRDFILKK